MNSANSVNHDKIQQECIPVGCVPPAAVAVHGRGGLPQCMLGYTPPSVGLVWTWSYPGCEPGDPLPGQTPQLPPGCGPGDPPGDLLQGILLKCCHQV